MSEGNPGEEVQGGGRGGVAESAITDLAATAGNDEDTDEIVRIPHTAPEIKNGFPALSGPAPRVRAGCEI